MISGKIVNSRSFALAGMKGLNEANMTEGDMEFETSGGLATAPEGYLPWFEVPGRATANTRMAFGHWSTLGSQTAAAKTGLLCNTLPLDTGCVWGGCLTAARLGQMPGEFELIQIRCKAEQKPDD